MTTDDTGKAECGHPFGSAVCPKCRDPDHESWPNSYSEGAYRREHGHLDTTSREVMNPPAQAEAGNLANTAPLSADHEAQRRGIDSRVIVAGGRQPVTDTAASDPSGWRRGAAEIIERARSVVPPTGAPEIDENDDFDALLWLRSKQGQYAGYPVGSQDHIRHEYFKASADELESLRAQNQKIKATCEGAVNSGDHSYEGMAVRDFALEVLTLIASPNER